MKYFKRTSVILLLALVAVLGVVLINWFIEKAVSSKVFNSTSEVSYNKVGLLLGTGKFLSNGRVNLYYTYRIRAAENLFKAGKVDFYSSERR